MRNLFWIISLAVSLHTFNVGAYSGPYAPGERDQRLAGDTNAPPRTEEFSLFQKWLSGAAFSTNWTFVGYFSLADSDKGVRRLGSGALAIYELTPYVGTAIGLDYLESFSLLSGNVELKVPIRAGPVVVTPFLVAGMGMGIGAATGGSVIAGGGAAVTVYRWKEDGGSLNLGYAAVNWSDAGDYSGLRHQIFAAFRVRF